MKGNLIREKIKLEMTERERKRRAKMRGSTLLKGPCGEHVGIAMCSFS